MLKTLHHHLITSDIGTEIFQKLDIMNFHTKMQIIQFTGN